jgi:enoyl-CoA hydratase/carnithine racemase
MPDSFTVTVERPELWLVTFDNPPLNKVDPEMILELQALVGQLEADPDVKVVVFDSAIPEHFLGPYDMTRAADTPSEPGPTGLPPWLDLTVRLARLPVVSIAVIRGVALGCGNEFALACDLRFASSERASIQQIGVHVGYGPGGGAVPRLPALIGRARTLEVILGSQPFDGAMAERYGLVNRALPDSELDAFVAALASDIARAGQFALMHAKTLVDPVTLPSDDDLVAAYEAFFSSVARPPD